MYGKPLIYIISVVLSIALYFFMQIIASFVQFGLFGSGEISASKSLWVSLCFVFFQVLLLLLIYWKKCLKDLPLLILNVLLVVSLFLYFVVF